MAREDAEEMTEEEKEEARKWNAAVRYYEGGEFETRRTLDEMNREAEERAEYEMWRD